MHLLDGKLLYQALCREVWSVWLSGLLLAWLCHAGPWVGGWERNTTSRTRTEPDMLC